MPPASCSAKPGHRFFCRARLSLYACALLAFGLLLWARLILVTGTPRTAMAQPERQAQVAAPQIPTNPD